MPSVRSSFRFAVPFMLWGLAAAIVATATWLVSAPAPAAAQANNQPHYGFFFARGSTLLRPNQVWHVGGLCRDPSCPGFNPTVTKTVIHTGIFETPYEVRHYTSIDWEFCRQLRQFMTENGFANRGLSCMGYSQYKTRAEAEAALAKAIASATTKEEFAKDIMIREFAYRADLRESRYAPFGSAALEPAQGSALVVPARQAPASGSGTAANIPAEPPVSAPVTSAQELAEIATRERLNREQAAFAQKQLAENAAAKAAFDKATAEREATIAAQAAETSRKQREYDAAMAKWRADVEACKKGDRSRCAQ